jgi:hypothetical protein
MSLSFFPRQKRGESYSERAEKRKDERERRLDRTEQELQERQASLRERERNVSRRERAAEQEASVGSSEDTAIAPFSQRQPGATAPGDMAAFIIASHEQANGKNAPERFLPKDPAAKLIVQAALGEFDEKAGRPANSTAALIVNADRVRRGEDPI